MLTEDVVIVRIKSYIVLVNVGIELISSQNFSDLHKLIVVILALEEWLFLEDHTCEHAA